MEPEIRVGVIGAGRMNQRAHIPNLLAEKCEIPAIADPRFETAKLVADAFRIETAYGYYQDLLDREEVDAVVVAVPDPLHAQIAMDALEAGKHVFLEKPMATNSDDAHRMLDAAHRAGKKLMVGYQRRHDPAAEITKRLMTEFSDTGELGRVISMEWRNYGGDWLWTVDPLIESKDDPPQESLDARMPPWLPQELWGEFSVVNNGFSHGIDLMQFVAGKPTAVLSAFPGYRSGTLIVLDWNGIRTLIHSAATEGSIWQEWLEVRYERGWLRFATPPALHSNQPGSVEVYRGAKGITERYEPPHQWAFRREIRHFLACIRDDASESPTPQEALDTLTIVEAVFHRAMAGHATYDITY